MPTIEQCENCPKKCPQAELAHQTALRLMYATNELVALVKKIENGQLLEVVHCEDCEAWQAKTAMSFLRDGSHVRCCTCSVYGRLMYNDDFCSKGKRRVADEQICAL